MSPARRRSFPSVRHAALLVLLCALSSGCAAYRAERVVDLHAPDAQALRRPNAGATEPAFVDSSPAFVAKRRIETAILVEPDLAEYVRSELETALGVEVEHVRVTSVGYRYAYSFPSRHDDFVLEVDVDAPAAGIAGTFEGRIRGNEHPDWPGSLEADWDEVVPDTGAGLSEGEQERRLERRVDQIAWMQRVKLLEVTRRLVAAVAAGDAR